MADNSLKDRLIEHAKSFDGLLSLIPAKFYYGEDNSDQWKRKKQTKKQAAAARRAKLDPDSAKTAKDVMDERARKRKLGEVEELDGSEFEGVQKELPKEGLKHADLKKSKKQKVTSLTDKPQHKTNSISTEKEEKNRLKQEKKQEKRKEKKKKNSNNNTKQVKRDSVIHREPDKEHTLPTLQGDIITDEDVSNIEKIDFEPDELEKGLRDENSASSNSRTSSPTFDSAIEPSTNTSTSSIIPPAKAPKNIKIPTDPELLRSRLAARIEALRAARKADGPDGRPARNRQELLEARRKKEDQRRAHKKELRLKAKAEEDARREAAIASTRNSPASGFLNPARSPDQNLSFGRVSFADGQQLTNDLSRLKSAPKKRGPQDPATALLATEKNLQRIAGFDEEKRADINEKDRWLKASKRVHGEKVLDDISLLKKTLKRKEKTKKKSEKEWTERKEGVVKSQAMKQKKREENLKKRREEKGSKGKGKGKVAKTKKLKVKSRPGFEGSFGSGRRK